MKGKQYSLNGLLVRKLLMSELATHRTGGKKPQSWTSLQSTPETPPHLGKDERSLSRYSPRAFWIFPSRSANLSRDLCTPWMFRTSITRGDFDTFFIRAKNSVLMLQVKSEARLLSAFTQCSQPSPSAPTRWRPNLWNRWVSTGSRCLMSALPVKMPSR